MLHSMTLVLLSLNSPMKQRRAEQQGLSTCNMRTYVSKFGDASMSLTDFAPATSAPSSSSSSSSSTSFYPTSLPPHVPRDEVKAGLKTGKFFKGVIRVKSNDRRDCYVILSGFSGKDRKSVTVRGELLLFDSDLSPLN